MALRVRGLSPVEVLPVFSSYVCRIHEIPLLRSLSIGRNLWWTDGPWWKVRELPLFVFFRVRATRLANALWQVSECRSFIYSVVTFDFRLKDEDIETIPISEETVNPVDEKIGPESFQLLKVLGKGGYGKVNEATYTHVSRRLWFSEWMHQMNCYWIIWMLTFVLLGF